MNHFLAASLLLFATVAAVAQAPAKAPPPCQGAEYCQFDFWIGTWDVYLADGQKAGENRIGSINDGCGLLENWSGRGGSVGKSLNLYDRDDQRWHQTWIDNTGGRLVIAGGLVDKRMVLDSETVAPGTPRQRITWTPNDDGSVRQLWESSADGGKTWTVQFDGRYVRR
jgi:hypothetical protein